MIQFFVQMKLNKFAYLYSKPNFKSYFRNNGKNTWKFTKKPGKIMEFCQSEKVGTLSLYRTQPREECPLCSVGIFIVNRNGKHQDSVYVEKTAE